MVGRHLVKALLPDYQLLTPSRSDLDLKDNSATRSYINKNKPDCLIHLAAKVGGIAANIADPVGFYIENARINANVIYASLKEEVPYLLNLGSSCMYPANRESLSEEDLLDGKLEPTNEGYALTKISATKLCSFISKQYSLQYKTIIPCNLYGPYDKFDNQRAHLIPAIIQKMHRAKMNNESVVTIWGSGKARREFMYVDDLVCFILLAIQKIEALPSWINVGLGRDYSVNDYYHAVADILGYSAQFEYDLAKPDGMLRKLLNVDKAKTLGWSAKTTLEEGIRNTYDYYQAHHSEALI